MNPVIVVMGAEGVLGRYACRHFSRLDWEVVAVGRRREGVACDDGDGMYLEWDGKNVGAWAMALEGAEAVVNLADGDDPGARLESTRALGRAVAGCRVAPRVWLNASTVDWYGEAADRIHDEWSGEPGERAASRAALAWEDAFFGAEVAPRTRKIAMRLGRVLVQEAEAGKIPGLAADEAWLHMEDFLRALEFLLDDAFFSGAANVTAPHGLKGESRVRPLRLADEGFVWRWGWPAEALADLAVRPGIDSFFESMVARPVGRGNGVPVGIF
jgi:NAD dependent epimerase/dehydratase family enzyme